MSQLMERLRSRPQLPSPAAARAIREAAEISQQALAEELGVHRVTVARWEAGQRRPRGSRRVAYAGLLEQLRRVIR